MTTSELNKILEDKNKKITLEEFRRILAELKLKTKINMIKITNKEDDEYSILYGERTAYQMVLALSEHIIEK